MKKTFAVNYLLILLLGLLSGCAGQKAVDDAPVISEGHADSYPQAFDAKVDTRGRIGIRYHTAGKVEYGKGSLIGFQPIVVGRSQTAAFGGVPPIVTLEVGSEHDDGGKAGTTPVAVRPLEDWVELVQQLSRESASLVPGKGVVLDLLRQQELFVFLDDQGNLQVSPLAKKTPGIEPALTLTLEELLISAFERIRRESPGTEYLLFNSGEVAYPFVLLMLQEERVMFFLTSSSSGRQTVTSTPGHAAQAAVHTLTGQVRSLTTQPFSTLVRLITSVSASVVDTVPRLGAWDSTEPPPPVNAGSPMDAVAWEQRLDQLVPDSHTSGRIVYLVDGGEYFPALIHAIGKAKESIRVRLYIFDNDDYAIKVADLLKSRSSEIPVKILLDGLGTITGGMAKAEFSPAHGRAQPASIVDYLQQNSDVRVRMLPNPWMQGDHTKVLLFDTSQAFLGGMNIGREYRYEWHDLMVALQGPVVERLAWDFDDAWVSAGFLGEFRARMQSAAGQEPLAASEVDYPVRLLYTKSGDPQILRTQLAALRNARQRVWIENAYLTSDVVLHELIAARRRGVDVRVVLPYRTDSGFIGRSNVLAANLLLSHGVRVYIYPGMSHVKAALYDGWACLGSANFDRLSLVLNKETNIATSDPGAVEGLVSQVFEPDFQRSLELEEALPSSWLDHLSELIADQL